MLMFLVGGLWALGRLNPTLPADVNIQGDHNVVLNITADNMGVTSEELRLIIEQALSIQERRQLERAASNVFAPSKTERGATVEVPGAYRVRPEAAAAVPSPDLLEDADPLEEYQSIDGAKIVVRATNLDDREHGWAGRLAISGRTWRVSVTLPVDVDLNEIKRKSDDGPIMVDLSVIYRPNRVGEFVPKIAQVSKVYSFGA